VPIYDFKCLDCGRVSEVLIRGTEQVPSCPDCGSASLERLMPSSFAMVKIGSQAPGTTCCGRAERCEASPCSTGETCRRH